MDDFEFDEGPATSRLAKPIPLNDVLERKLCDFSIRTDDDDQCLGELDTDLTKVYDYDKLEEVCMPENLECEDSDDDNDPIDPDAPFARFRRGMTKVTEDGKILKKIETHGHGPTLPAGENVAVYVHYNAYLELAEYPFDSTRLRFKRPAKFFLGDGKILIGFELALRSMAVGEKSKFIVHPDLAFGAHGCPPRVPANASILYDIELVDFVETVNSTSKTDEDGQTSFEDALKKSMTYRNMAKKKLELEKDVRAAIKMYKRGLQLVLLVHYDTDEQDALRKVELLKLYTNLAVCYMRTDQPKQTCNMFNEAVKECGKLTNNNVKLYYTSAKALRKLAAYDEALKRLKRANSLRPGDEAICAEIEKLNEARTNAIRAERSMSQRMFGFAPDNESKEDDEKVEVSDDFINALEEIIDKFLVQEVEESTRLDFSYTMAEKSFIIKYCKKRKLVHKTLDSGTIIIRKPAF